MGEGKGKGSRRERKKKKLETGKTVIERKKLMKGKDSEILSGDENMEEEEGKRKEKGGERKEREKTEYKVINTGMEIRARREGRERHKGKSVSEK